MKVFLVILGYLKWHYSKALYSLTDIWKNFLYFIFEFFSIKLLFKNYLDPWKRMADSYPKKFSFKTYTSVFITNIIVRVVGIIMRTFLILIGMICYILLALLYPVIIIIWLFLPLIITLLICEGLYLIIK